MEQTEVRQVAGGDGSFVRRARRCTPDEQMAPLPEFSILTDNTLSSTAEPGTPTREEEKR